MLEEITLKGFPTQIGKEIELPDMAELLMYPIFHSDPIEEVRKRGSEFQKMLLDQVVLTNTKKYAYLETNVRILAPKYRAVTTTNSGDGWHIDYHYGGNKHQTIEETDIIHLLLSKTSSMTQFLKKPLTIKYDTNNLKDFFAFLQKKIVEQNLEYESIPANRFVTFSNHPHRADEVKQLEFRYMFRVVETDFYVKPEDEEYRYTVSTFDPENKWIPNIRYTNQTVNLIIPKSVKTEKEKYGVHEIIKEHVPGNRIMFDYIYYNPRFEKSDNTKSIVITHLLTKDDISLMEHLEDMKGITTYLREKNNLQNYFTLSINDVMYEETLSFGPILKATLLMNIEVIGYMKKDVEYILEIADNDFFINNKKLTFFIEEF